MLVNYTYSTNKQLSLMEARAKGFPTGGENQNNDNERNKV